MKMFFLNIIIFSFLSMTLANENNPQYPLLGVIGSNVYVLSSAKEMIYSTAGTKSYYYNFDINSHLLVPALNSIPTPDGKYLISSTNYELHFYPMKEIKKSPSRPRFAPDILKKLQYRYPSLSNDIEHFTPPIFTENNLFGPAHTVAQIKSDKYRVATVKKNQLFFKDYKIFKSKAETATKNHMPQKLCSNIEFLFSQAKLSKDGKLLAVLKNETQETIIYDTKNTKRCLPVAIITFPIFDLDFNQKNDSIIFSSSVTDPIYGESNNPHETSINTFVMKNFGTFHAKIIQLSFNYPSQDNFNGQFSKDDRIFDVHQTNQYGRPAFGLVAWPALDTIDNRYDCHPIDSKTGRHLASTCTDDTLKQVKQKEIILGPTSYRCKAKLDLILTPKNDQGIWQKVIRFFVSDWDNNNPLAKIKTSDLAAVCDAMI